MTSRKIKKVFMLASILLLLIQGQNLFAQSNTFPQGSTQGTTEMNQNVRGSGVPNIAVQITEPRTGNEVAFSVRLLLLQIGRAHV